MSDDIAVYLKDGWELAGYSTTIMAMGAMTHSMLLRKEARLISITVVTNGGKAIGRSAVVLS